MVIIADSGSTKTDLVVLSDGKLTKSVQTIGMNPYFISSEEISATLERELTPLINPDDIRHIYFYGAGCSFDDKRNIVKKGFESIFNAATIKVDHDLMGAARALYKNEKGIVGILGTGSNSCVYDGRDIVAKIFSTGYIFGDEGSGAYIGKNFITQHLKKRSPKEISKSFHQFYGYSDEDILTNVYKKPFPNKYLATFSIFIKQYISNPYMASLVEESFVDYFREQVASLPDYKNLPFSFIGSVGCNFIEQVRKAAAKYDIEISKYMVSPIEGLIEYHAN